MEQFDPSFVGTLIYQKQISVCFLLLLHMLGLVTDYYFLVLCLHTERATHVL